MKQSTPLIRDRARRLRRNQTYAEQKLWIFLRSRQLAGFKFRRHYPVGSFIVDFCCFERRLVIELDGGQHADHTVADQRKTRGYRVLRFWDNEVINEIDAVLERIRQVLNQPSPYPLPKGEGEDT